MSDGKGCKCGAYGSCECGCPDVDWTPQEVYDLRKRLSHLMDVAGKMAGALEPLAELPIEAWKKKGEYYNLEVKYASIRTLIQAINEAKLALASWQDFNNKQGESK